MTLSKRVMAFARRMVPVDSYLRRRYRAFRSARRPEQLLLRAFAAANPDAVFVQIGSNDGVNTDPLRPHILRNRWRGILVEPVPQVYERLKRNYAQCAERLRLENVAVADQDGVLPFYHLVPVADYQSAGLPVWHDQLGSFLRDVVVSHRNIIPDIEDRIVQRDIEAVTFNTLCARNGVDRVDLLHTDTEGFDFHILKTVDFSRFRPRIVIYEHTHLTREDQLSAMAYMEEKGYACARINMDTWCLNQQALADRDRHVVRAWERMPRRLPS